MASKKTDLNLTKDILIAEFEYISQTAAQTNEDRARVSSFYLVAVGSLVAGLFSTQLLDQKFNTQILNLLLSGLFVVLTLLGTFTIAQLARLRGAWYESILAMNQLKEYAIAQDKHISKAFRWRVRTAPNLYKINSVSFIQTVEVAMLSALTSAAAMYSFTSGIGYANKTFQWMWVIAGALFVLLLQIFIYRRLIQNEQKRFN